MLIPFDMLAVLLFLGFYLARQPETAPPPLSVSLAILAAYGLGTALLGAFLNLASKRKLKKWRSPFRRMAAFYDAAARGILVAAYIMAMVDSALPWTLAKRLGWNASDIFKLQFIGLACYVFLFLCLWPTLYGIHRMVVPGQWTRLSYLVHKARYNLFILAAWLPFALFSGWLSHVTFAIPLAIAIGAWGFPWALARLWGCKPLPPGEAADSVKRLEEKVGTGFSKAYLWEPGGGRVQNAAAVGLFRPFRYLFLTPALIAGMPRPELEAVILHELGHVRKMHLLFYLVTTLAGLNLAVLLPELAPLSTDTERFLVTAIMILGYFRFVFGWLSRNMERQADLFSMRESGGAGHMINALERLALSAGNIRNAHSWHHMGIAERVSFLRRAEARPELADLHDAKVRTIMTAGYLASMAFMAAMGYLLFQPPPNGGKARAPESYDAHWRRVMALLPDDATGALELAYRLADRPERRGEAMELAARAERQAEGKEQRAAAAKLLKDLSEGKSPEPDAASP